MPHIDEVRASKSSFQLSKVLSFVNNIASSTVAKISKNAGSSWTALSNAISELSAQTNALFPKTTDLENVVKSVYGIRLLRITSDSRCSYWDAPMDSSC